MCHHMGDATRDPWRREEAEDEEEDEEPSFINEESEVEVDLLEADDD
ncbi:MAG: hypothetical protein ACI8UR_002482 [Natronomonas sp.]|jgi:hypothetical protein